MFAMMVRVAANFCLYFFVTVVTCCLIRPNCYDKYSINLDKSHDIFRANSLSVLYDAVINFTGPENY